MGILVKMSYCQMDYRDVEDSLEAAGFPCAPVPAFPP